jgi:hypothetical protein
VKEVLKYAIIISLSFALGFGLSWILRGCVSDGPGMERVTTSISNIKAGIAAATAAQHAAAGYGREIESTARNIGNSIDKLDGAIRRIGDVLETVQLREGSGNMDISWRDSDRGRRYYLYGG